MAKLPISVISPVRNCGKAIKGHAEHLRKLADVVEEIIVVDSDSSDGTLEHLKEKLADLPVKFLNHPPGLYQSWNHGMAAASQPFCNIATVGDTLPVQSLVRLYETIQRLGGDVVISAPVIIDHKGRRSTRRWPVHQVIAAAKLKEPTVISPVDWLVITLGFFPATLISSSAGNLYRTRLMQENPFPFCYGHPGDCAWALQMSRKARWIIDPTVESYFWLHPPSCHRAKRSEERAQAMSSMAAAVFSESESFLRQEGISDDIIETLRNVPQQMLQKTSVRMRYRKARIRFLPRFIQPAALRLKKEQDALYKLIDERLARTLAFASKKYAAEPASHFQLH